MIKGSCDSILIWFEVLRALKKITIFCICLTKTIIKIFFSDLYQLVKHILFFSGFYNDLLFK